MPCNKTSFINNFIGIIKNIGKLKFGVAAIALTGFVVATKLINTAREKERMAIEGVGRAANLTSKQVYDWFRHKREKLNDFDVDNKFDYVFFLDYV